MTRPRRAKSRFAGIAYVRIGKDGKLQVLRISYNHRDKIQWKLPGGGVKKKETPEQGGTREGTEETGLHPRKVYYLCKITTPHDSGEGVHIKYFYLAIEDECTGILRTKDFWDNGTEIGSFIWTDLEEFLEIVFDTHEAPLLEIWRCRDKIVQFIKSRAGSS